MYETITLALPFQKSSELFIRTFQVRPATFYANNVKRLYITGIITFDQAQKVIAACSAAREVTCWIYPHTLHENYLQQLPTHHLRRLSINLESLWGIKPLTIDWTSTLFPNLTHLEVVNPPGTYESPMIDWDGLKKLPALTHFALGELFFTHHSFIITPLGKMLVECPHLKVVVIVTRETSLVEKLRKSCILDDRRVVVQSDYNGSLGLDEYWTEVRNGNWDFWAASERDIASGKNIVCWSILTII